MRCTRCNQNFEVLGLKEGLCFGCWLKNKVEKLEEENKRLKSENGELKDKYDSLEKEFRVYVNSRGRSKDYEAGGGWRR